MGRLVDTDNLVFVKDITERLNKSVTMVTEWSKREDFPAPVMPPARGRPTIYLWSEVIEWWQNWERTKSKGGRHSTNAPRVRRPKNPCPVKNCTRTRQIDSRGKVRAFCRFHMKEFVWDVKRPASP